MALLALPPTPQMPCALILQAISTSSAPSKSKVNPCALSQQTSPGAPDCLARVEQVHNSAGHTSGWSTCEAGYTAVGIHSIVLDLKHGHPHHAEIDDYTCDSRGCRARCVGRDCTVQARCCMP